jgi:hypothetical protein
VELLQRGNDSLHETVSKLRQQSRDALACSSAPAQDDVKPADVATRSVDADGAASQIERCAGTMKASVWWT